MLVFVVMPDGPPELSPPEESAQHGVPEISPEPGPQPEVVFALVYPVGTDADLVTQTLVQALADVGYERTTLLHLIRRLEASTYRPSEQAQKAGGQQAWELDQDPDQVKGEYAAYMRRMNLGNYFREDVDEPDAMARFAAALIFRERLQEDPEMKELGVRPQHAYIIRSIKRPEEIRFLRAVYGDALVVLAAHTREEQLRDELTWRVSKSAVETGPPDQFRPLAETLIARDQREGRSEWTWGQRLSDAFPLADVYFDASHPARLRRSMTRFVNLCFGYQFHTPTRAEYGMYHAYGAAMRSADLSRQVGAAIVDADGEVVALGCNEVPKGGGGLYWEQTDGPEDGRDFTFGRDTSSDIKRAAVNQLYERLRRAKLLADATVLGQIWLEIQGIDLMNTGEFGRAAHAEMAAIVHAARRGRSVHGCKLYTTTFPCQVCARHIVAAGIKTVVYNEPYPKSLARYLYSDSIVMGKEGDEHTVGFIPFDGVASPLYADLFRSPSSNRRKNDDGTIPQWSKATATPRRYGHPYLYVAHEAYALKSLVHTLKTKGLGI